MRFNMDNKLDIRTYVYMIREKEKGFVCNECFESESLAEFIMEIRYTSYWIKNGKVVLYQ
jgi:hypothetical protein